GVGRGARAGGAACGGGGASFVNARRGENTRPAGVRTAGRLFVPGDALAGHGRALLLEAVAAVHRAVEAGHERHGRLAAAVGAGHGREFPPARAVAPPVGPAGGAALRLIEQALLEVEPLFPRCEDERHAAIPARERLVFECHGSFLLETGSTPARTQARPRGGCTRAATAPSVGE